MSELDVMAPYVPTLSRRATLEWMMAVSLASALPRATLGEPKAVGYGLDPDLNKPVVPWPLIMQPRQLHQTAVLADIILPGTPAPSTLGVADFVNEWVSAPYPDQLQDRAVVFEGLRWLDAESVRSGRAAFLECDPQVRQGIVDDIARKGSLPAERAVFFQRMRFLVVSAYYTTPEGFRDIGYTGNVPLAEYPPLTSEERTILDGALAKLGL
jgi:hypothetical protein